MKTLISFILLVFFLGAMGLRADDLILANGQAVSGSVSRVDPDGVVIQTERGAVKYRWLHLNAESSKAWQAKWELQRNQDAMHSDFLRKMESGEIKIFTPKEIQTSAFSLKDITVLMAATRPKAQEIAAGQYRVEWDYHVESTMTTDRAIKAMESEALFVRVISPEKYNSKIEVLGNILVRSDDGIAPGWKQ
jgi:hypothetical protein